MVNNLCAFFVFFSFAAGVYPAAAGNAYGGIVGEQDHRFYSVENGQDGPYLDETVTIDSFRNKVAMFSFEAERKAAAILKITRLTPDKRISWGFVGINNNLYRLEDFLSGLDPVFARDVELGKNNHVFVHLFGEQGACLHVQVLPPLPAILDFTVSPDWVAAGLPAVLTWSTLQADTVFIEPGIGRTTPSGSWEVAPDATTTYTLTAQNSYGSTSVPVTLEVLTPPQLDLVEPDGLNDLADESFIIRWTDADPDSSAEIALYYDTDSTGANGTLIVSGLPEDPDGTADQYLWDTVLLEPGEYYVYAVVDDGRNAPVTVYSPGPVTKAAAAPPAVSISADPASIPAGGSTILSWTTTDADTCFIEPDIGSVDTTGSMVVTPAATTTYIISAFGPGGLATDSVTVQVDCPMTITIDSPANGDFVSVISVPVTGAVTHAGNKETGVTVNGVPGIISGNRFRADHVFLTYGENLITATATDAEEVTVSTSITVEADTSGDYIVLSADPVSGIPPFASTLQITGSIDFASSDIAYDGPGTVTFLENGDDEYRVVMDTTGIYTFTATVTDDRGAVYTDSMAAEVIDAVALDQLLRAKWDGLTAALAAGDIAGALKFHHTGVRERYTAIYNALGSSLPVLARSMKPVSPVLIEGSRAKYRTTQDHMVEGQTVTVTYYVCFSRDESGLWKIEMY